MSDQADWLASLKVGDRVVVRYASGKAGYPGRITQIGATLIIVNGGSRFKRNGQQGYYGLWLEKPTAAQARKAKR